MAMRSVLLCSSPVRGKFIPMLAVARYLVERGDRVRFLTGSRFRADVEATGATFLPLPADADFDGDNLDAEFPERVGLTGLAGIRHDLIKIFIMKAGSQFTAINEAISAAPVDAIIAESEFFGAAIMLTKPRRERPMVVNFGTMSLYFDDPDAPPGGTGLLPMPGPLGRLRNRLARMIIGVLVFRAAERRLAEVSVQSAGRALGGGVMEWQRLADATVQATVRGFEFPRPTMPDTVHFIGPTSKGAESGIPTPDWWGDLDGARPVVHVTQGTVANADYGTLIRPAIEGLAGSDALVVVTTGGRDVSTVDFPVPDNVRIAAYLPYEKLLPRTDVFVTNGGFGGVQQAIEHGIPIVVAGTSEEKTDVAARVGWTGVGVNLKTNQPTPAALAAAVRKVRTEPRYRAAAERMSAEIAESPGLAGLGRILDAGTAGDVWRSQGGEPSPRE